MLLTLLVILAFAGLIGAVCFVFWTIGHAEDQYKRLTGHLPGFIDEAEL